MPKMKSNSGAKKRFRLTGSGRVKRYKAGKSHILTKKSTKQKRRLRHGTTVDKVQEHQIKLMLPYGTK
jgi:large subunit ribosomal protein L35